MIDTSLARDTRVLNKYCNITFARLYLNLSDMTEMTLDRYFWVGDFFPFRNDSMYDNKHWRYDNQYSKFSVQFSSV